MKSKVGKIILTVCASLVGLLTIATIVLACTKYTAFGIVNDKAYSMEVYKSGYEEIPTYTYVKGNTDDEAIMKQVYEKANLAQKENNLSALFQGVGKFETKVKNIQTDMEEVLNMAEGSYYIKLNYNEAQKLVIDGKDYINQNSSTKETVKYNALWMEVKNTANFTSYRLYLIDYSLSSDENQSYFQVEVIGQQADLYAYIGSLTK